MSNTTNNRPTELVAECRLGYHDVCESQDAAGTFCECECHTEADSLMPLSGEEASWHAERVAAVERVLGVCAGRA